MSSELRRLLRRPGLVTRMDVAARLDPMTPEGRALACRTLSSRDLNRLWDLAADGPPVARADLLPDGLPPLRPVLHDGWNALPLPAALRRFTKPMCGLPDTDELAGYNDGLARPFLGPGYFVARPALPEHRIRGAWVVDYLRVPDGPVAPGWPRIVPTSTGFRPHRLVYGGTRDYLRKVSDGVVVGLPFKWGRRLAFPFTLVRRD